MCRGQIELSNTSNGASVWIDESPLLKGTLVFVLLALLSITALLSVSFLVVEVSKDGYRRMPQRPLVRIY